MILKEKIAQNVAQSIVRLRQYATTSAKKVVKSGAKI
jgi:hypothetical protein